MPFVFKASSLKRSVVWLFLQTDVFRFKSANEKNCFH